MRGALAIVAMGALGGCYHPNAATGVPCSSDEHCPDGQTCDTGQQPPLCMGSVAGNDASADSPIDSSTTTFDVSMMACGGATCTGATPVCAQDVCRGCIADAECPSNACNEGTGTCVDEAAVVYVDATGVDPATKGSDDCTSAAPCLTVSYAATVASATRAMIRVGPGTYQDAVLIKTLAFPLLLSGPQTDPGAAIVHYMTADSSKDHLIELQAGSMTIEGMRFEGATQEVVRAQSNGTTLTIERSYVTGGKGGIDDANAAVVVRQSTITASTGIGINVAGGGGSLQLERSTVSAHTGVGISVASATFKIDDSVIAANQSGGVAITGAITNSEVKFDTFVDNVGTSEAIRSANALPVIDSIFSHNGAPQIASPVTATYSLFTDTNPGGTGNLVAEPMFVDGSAGNYHLAPGSPAVDVGVDAMITVDFDGDTRPQGAGFDIGCDELKP